MNQDRFPVLDCWISRTSMAEAIQNVTEQSAGGEGGYVCFSNVHSVVTSRHDELLRVARVAGSDQDNILIK